MISLIGRTSLDLALLTAVAGSIAAFGGAISGKRAGAFWGRRAVFTVLGLVAFAVVCMEVALITHDFSVKYVSENGSTTTPVYYTIISLWGALEGSILFWALLLSAYSTLFLLLYRHRFGDLMAWITGILLGNSAFFLLVIVGPGNPFAPVDPAAPAVGCPSTGCGPNPLLQNHPMMGLHPPLLYLGYTGLTIPFAIAMAGLLNGSIGPEVLRLIRRWALIPWVFLSLGIVAGMWWSYAVLGWGGYWSWDPVENASVMPWLVTTAFLHSLQVQERRGMLKVWTLSLIVTSFLLVILGTFLTRSGILASVHSFTQSAIGPVFLSFFAVVLIGSLSILLWRSKDLEAPGALDAVVCRESAFMFNNLLLVAITFTILLGTVFPLIGEALQGTQFSVGAPYFNNVDVPVGVALIFLMGVGPVLPWGAANLENLQWRLLGPVAVGTAVVLLLLALGVRGVGTIATFGLAGFVLAVTLIRIGDDVRVRQGNTAESWMRAARRLFRANPRRYGGYIVHIGVLCIVVGIAASQSYGVRAAETLKPGQTLTVDGYRATFTGFKAHWDGRRMVLAAAIHATRDGEDLGMMYPAQNIYPTMAQPVVTPAVREEPIDMVTGLFNGRDPLPDLAQLSQGRNPVEDFYLVLEAIGTNPHHRTITLQVLVNPLVGLIWLGGVVMGLGGIFALTPAPRRRKVTVEAREPVRLAPEEVTA
jgi:cytochrome c-type biogenesis protein CcmF